MKNVWLGKMKHGGVPYAVLTCVCLALYANTFGHQFALDDNIVICKNEYVLRGLAGIPDIFRNDVFDSYRRQMNSTEQLTGGRYRPLSVASYAVEQELIGTRRGAVYEPGCWDVDKNNRQDPGEDVNADGVYNDKDCRGRGFPLRHVVNVFLYAVACCLLFLFLKSVVFEKSPQTALIVSLLFAAHPVHTEVVANVKSRDEILSCVFILLTLILVHRHDAKRRIPAAVLACLAYFCALLSKEYGVVVLLVAPLSLYLFRANGLSVRRVAPIMVGLVLVFGGYYGIRSRSIMGRSDLPATELMNNPYQLASSEQRLASKLFIPLKYLTLQVLPHPLCSDYGYKSIPYQDFSSARVWMSILVLAGMLAALFVALRKRHWVAFALAVYLLPLLLVTNIIFNVGATMGERLIFHSSIGFCMIAGGFLAWLGENLKKKWLAATILIPILALYSMKTVSRNEAWENDVTLELTDVKINPESVALNGNAAARMIDLSELPQNKPQEQQLLRSAIGYASKAITLYPHYVNGYLNLGLAHAKMEQYDRAREYWGRAFSLYPQHPSKTLYYGLLAKAYYRDGFNLGQAGRLKAGMESMQKAVDLTPGNARYWYELGRLAYEDQDRARARKAWARAYQLDPADESIGKAQALVRE